jgi:hypothetical protein
MRVASSQQAKGVEMIEDGFAAAEDYLTLHFSRETAIGLVDRLRRENVQYFKVKDIFRAAKMKYRQFTGAEQVVLLVRASNGLIIADGYEFVCEAWLENKEKLIACKIV